MANELARQRYARKNEQDELERVFRTLDKNGDGKVDSEELGLLFQALGHKVCLYTSITPMRCSVYSNLLACALTPCSPTEER